MNKFKYCLLMLCSISSFANSIQQLPVKALMVKMSHAVECLPPVKLAQTVKMSHVVECLPRQISSDGKNVHVVECLPPVKLAQMVKMSHVVECPPPAKLVLTAKCSVRWRQNN
jgi:hypothetical protein